MGSPGAEPLIPWSDSTANSSRTRAAIRQAFGLHVNGTDDGNGSQMVDYIIGIISDTVNSGGEHQPATIALLQALYSIIIVCGVVVNVLVWVVFARQPKLRTTRNLFVLNLCASDILLCLVTMPVTLVFLIEAKWTLGLHLCKLVPLIQCSNVLVGTGTVIVIALDRHNTIVKSPCACRRRVSTGAFICGMWAVALLASAPLSVFSRIEPFPFPSWQGHSPVFSLYEVCIEAWPDDSARASFTCAVLLVQYLAPVVTLCVTHVHITRFLRAHLAAGGLQQRLGAEMNRNRRVTTVLSLIVAVFAVSWLPYHLFVLLDEFHWISVRTPNYSLGFAACHLLAMSTVVSNPVLYGVLNTNFQREWDQLVGRSRRHGPPPTPDAADHHQPTTMQMLTLLPTEGASSTAVSHLVSDRSSPRALVTRL